MLYPFFTSDLISFTKTNELSRGKRLVRIVWQYFIHSFDRIFWNGLPLVNFTYNNTFVNLISKLTHLSNNYSGEMYNMIVDEDEFHRKCTWSWNKRKNKLKINIWNFYFLLVSLTNKCQIRSNPYAKTFKLL